MISIDGKKDVIVLPEGYKIRNGFLFKGDTPVALVASGLVKIAAQGFLHVDETDKYNRDAPE